jgi:hypothetical protein
MCVVPHPDYPRRVTHSNRTIWYILGNNGVCSDYRAVSDTYPIEDDDTKS